MCGIAGLITSPRASIELEGLMRPVLDRLSHRGPDDQGIWSSATEGLVLGQRRLAILDLSPEGHQPMHSASGRFSIVFNGEIYNYLTPRRELETRGYSFRGHSDTEVMLAAFEEWGIEAALGKFIGMFAFALYDARDKTLTLARDRLGVKPLYYGWTRSTFIFASELKAFFALPDFHADLESESVADYLQLGYVPAPHSIFRNVFKLEPGCTLQLPSIATTRPTGFCPYSHKDQRNSKSSCAPQRYWTLPTPRPNPKQAHKSEKEIVEEFSGLLQDSVNLRRIADVPLGAFLSGGIDSSLVVALLSRQSSSPVKTFSVGFSDANFNEAPFAARVAKHLHTDHHELHLEARDALALIPELADVYCEPFADSSALPTLLVCRFARQHVTVSLSGDGGDELCSGYSRYQWAMQVERLRGLPNPIRALTATCLGTIPQALWTKLDAICATRKKVFNVHEKLLKLSRLLSTPDFGTLYRALLSTWEEALVTENVLSNRSEFSRQERWASELNDSSLSALQRMGYTDASLYLPDDILVKVDRASMRYGLEAREPLLDHRLFEFMSQLPDNFRIRDGQSKWLIKEALRPLVPEALTLRPKQGFGIPLGSWLRGELSDWAHDLLNEDRLRKQGLLRVEAISKKWHEHKAGAHDWQGYLWNVLMFQSWYARYME